MRRNMLAAVTAAAMLGMGVAPARGFDDWDDEESRLKREEAAKAAHEEREAQHKEHVKRIEARREAEAERRRRSDEEFEMLRKGIEPSTGRPLSRQRRRALSRRDFPFYEQSTRGLPDSPKSAGDR